MKKNLQDLIPSENLALYLHLYKTIKEREMDVKDAYFPFDEVERIRGSLQDFARRGYLKKEDPQDIISFIYSRIVRKDDLKRIPARISALLLSRQGAPKDWGLDVLVWCLVSDCRIYSNRPGYVAVADYFNHEGISGTVWSDINIRKRFEKLEFDRIRDILTAFDFLLGPGLNLILNKKYDRDGCLRDL